MNDQQIQQTIDEKTTPITQEQEEEEEEWIEKFTENGEPTGESFPRSQIHEEGIWHNTITIWVVLEKSGELLLQKRSSLKDTFPDKWDASCAGHISFGQTPREAAIRELEEELGLRIEMGQLRFVTRTKVQSTGFVTIHTSDKNVVCPCPPCQTSSVTAANDPNGENGEQKQKQWIDNEWMDIFLVVLPRSALDNIKLQTSEVSDVTLIHYSALRELYDRRDERLVCCVNKKDSRVLWSMLEELFPTEKSADTCKLPVNFV